MRAHMGLFLAVLAIGGCAELGPSPEERAAHKAQVLREWLRGPMMASCASQAGPDSRRGCVMVLDGILAKFRGEHLTREDHYRIELAKAKGTDEIWRLWTRAEREAWLHGPRTLACQQAPFPSAIQNCLNGVQSDLDVMSRPDDLTGDPPEIRAERAVARIEAQEQGRALERQRAHELELVQQQAAGQALLGLGIGGGLFQNTVTPAAPIYQPQPVPVLPLTQPQRLTAPPVSCTSQRAGQTVYTNCY